MVHALIYHGFPVHWKTGRFERIIYHDIINQIDNAYPDPKKNLVINGTWLNWDFQHSVEALLSVYQPDRVFIGSMVDPWEMQAWAANKFSDSEIVMFGNVSGPYAFNFWAMYCDHTWPQYTLEQTTLADDFRFSFLCYQRRPKLHRQILTSRMLDHNLDKTGLVTLGQDDFLFDNLKKITIEDSHDVLGIGKLEIWNHCFLNIVSETERAGHADVFISEKAWQPIVGLRPFLIYGDTRIYDYLESQGFDVFSDIFPVDEMKRLPDFDHCSDIIVDTIKCLDRLNKVDLKKMWVDLLPRLTKNKKRFSEFVQEQQHLCRNLF
jgi:hypothetical protein